MKGTNQLQLNQQTIVEALQEYLSARYTQPITVKSVKELDVYCGDSVFVIEVSGHDVVASVSGEQKVVCDERDTY